MLSIRWYHTVQLFDYDDGKVICSRLAFAVCLALVELFFYFRHIENWVGEKGVWDGSFHYVGNDPH